MRPTSNSWLQFLTLAGLLLLGWNAAHTTVWDDETNGFFLAREPLPHLMKLMAANVHEDPPLYDLALHCWQLWAGYDPFKLRLLSILCWGVALGGLYQCATRWSGARTGWMVLALAAWMPYHWMFPAAIRWYSMFAAFAAWNLFALLQALGVPGGEPLSGFKGRWGCFALYVFTGAAMWYCNYSAPAVFLAQGLAALLVLRLRLQCWLWLLTAWAAIGLCYLPWLAVFLRQLGISESSFSLTFTAASIYAIFAGEVSTPYDWWISLPVAVSALAALLLLIQTNRSTRFIMTLVVVILGVMVAKNVIWTKRLLVFTPFLALGLGVALSASCNNESRASLLVRRLFVGASFIMVIGSLVNLYRRDGWLTYRWLVPTGEVVEAVRRGQPGSLILSNSNSVAFYCHDPLGMNMAARFPGRIGEMEMMPFAPGLSAEALQFILGKLSKCVQAVYIHDSSSVTCSSVLPWIEEQMSAAGYSKKSIEPMAMASASYLKHHPGTGSLANPIDTARLVVVRFEKNSKP